MCGSKCRERDIGAVARRAVAGGAGGHQDRAGQHGGRFEQQLVARGRGGRFAPAIAVGRRIHARQQRIERDLLQHEAAIVAAVVDAVQIPLAEVVIGPLAGRVIEVVGPRIERQLFDQLRIEPGLLQNLGIGVAENRQRSLDQLFVHAGRDADIVNVQRNRPHALVGDTAPSAARIRARRPADSRGSR